MTDADRQYTGNMLTSLWRMSDRLFAEPKVCDGCGGSGLVPANSGHDSSDFKCGECNGKGVRP